MDDLLQRVRRCEALQQPEWGDPSRLRRGKALVPGYPQGYCENHYIHSFELESGRIKRNREFMNPIQKLRALGIAVPQIKRDGIPT